MEAALKKRPAASGGKGSFRKKRLPDAPKAGLLILLFLGLFGIHPAPAAGPAPVIREVVTNGGAYPGGKIPRHEKLEITFQIDTSAANLQMPYDPAPPTGVQPGTGISVDALFTPDNWKTVYKQTAFYYQDFFHKFNGGNEWIYPSGKFAWKVRFAPDKAGLWLFKLAVQDVGGAVESPAYRFEVAPSSNPGFLRVSSADPRYFEFEDGAYFPALGYNMNYNRVSWDEPILDNRTNFQAMSRNGIQLARIWLSQWGIYGGSWSPWNSPDPEWHGQYIPWLGLTFEQAYPGSEVSMALRADENPCMFLGFMKAPPAVKRNASYRIRIRYKTMGMSGPRAAGLPYGFVAKTGGWLWGDEGYCFEPGSGKVITDYQSSDSGGWQILEGRLRTGDRDFLPYFYLVMENISHGEAFVDSVWIEEDLGNGRYGPNIVSRSWMAHHLAMDQRMSYAFDQVLDLAHRFGIYLRPVILEKNDWTFNSIDDEGRPVPDDQSNDWFYGDGRRLTKVRWLQQAWWRYLQARWGYSPNIHSWELLNEGDPANPLHYQLADEFGRYMHQFAPNAHMTSTSFWHSFPSVDFWANPAYSNVDFADIHAYVDDNSPDFADTAEATYALSMQVGAKQPEGAGKPVLRGEVAFIEEDSGWPTGQFEADTQGIWLHNFIWGGINPGGLIEAYWDEGEHIYLRDEGNWIFDHRPVFRTYYNFIRDIPLNNGRYQDASAQLSTPALRAWGQKDLRSGRAHLWIQNMSHTWQNVVEGKWIEPASGTVTLDGFKGGKDYLIEWWDTYQPIPARQIVQTETLVANPDGTLDIPVENLTSDIAIKIKVP
jgi:hypothetical protein